MSELLWFDTGNIIRPAAKLLAATVLTGAGIGVLFAAAENRDVHDCQRWLTRHTVGEKVATIDNSCARVDGSIPFKTDFSPDTLPDGTRIHTNVVTEYVLPRPESLDSLRSSYVDDGLTGLSLGGAAGAACVAIGIAAGRIRRHQQI